MSRLTGSATPYDCVAAVLIGLAIGVNVRDVVVAAVLIIAALAAWWFLTERYREAYWR